MKKIATLLLFIIPIYAYADWVYVSSSDVGEYYYDPTRIKRNDEYVDVWTLFDLRNPVNINGEKEKSRISKDRHSCKTDKSTTISMSTFSEKQGNGRLLFTGEVPKEVWIAIPYNSNIELVHNLICK